MAARSSIVQLKQFFNTSDDNDLFVDAVNRTTENEYENHQAKDDPTETTESLESF